MLYDVQTVPQSPLKVESTGTTPIPTTPKPSVESDSNKDLSERSPLHIPYHVIAVRTLVYEKAEKHNLNGLSMMSKGRFIAAISEFNKAIYLLPREMSYVFHRAECYLSINDIQGAIDNYRRVCQNSFQPKFVPRRLAKAYFTHGLVEMDKGQLYIALEKFERSYNLFKGNDQLIMAMVMCHLGLDEMDEAFAYLNKLIQKYDKEPDLYVIRAKMYQSQEDVSLIIAQVYHNLEIIKKLHPNHPEVPYLQRIVNDIVVQYRNKAFEFVGVGEVRKAITCLTKAILIIKDALLLTQRGLLFHQIGDYRHAIEDLQPIVEQEKMDVSKEVLTKLADSFYHLALGFVRYGDGHEAIKAVSQAIRYNSTAVEYYKLRAECHESFERYSEAVNDYSMCYNLHDDPIYNQMTSSLLYKIAVQKYKDKNYVKALDTLNRCIKTVVLVEALLLRAKTFYKLQNTKAAIEGIIEVLKINPGNVEAQRFLLEDICNGSDTDLANILQAYSIVPFPEYSTNEIKLQPDIIEPVNHNTSSAIIPNTPKTSIIESQFQKL
ncbi:TPR-like protein, partial [Rozella allomycis CSF55]